MKEILAMDDEDGDKPLQTTTDGSFYEGIYNCDDEDGEEEDSSSMLQKDWEYSMRREMQEIIPRVYLGPYASAMKSKLESLLSKGITHIICIRQLIEANFIRPNFPQHFRYLVLDIADRPTENIIPHFRTARSFIDECLESGGTILVHGNGGISRSAAIIVAYVMEKCSYTFSDAMFYVCTKRFCVSMNEGFVHQLKEYEHIYRAQAVRNMSDAFQQIEGETKRKRKELEEEESPS